MHWQRWRRTGDPTVLVGRGRPRKDAWEHGSRRGYDQGCRCFPCRIAENRYQNAWRTTGRGVRVPAAQVVAHLQELLASGWTKAEIRRAAGLGNSTVFHILAGRSKQVNSRTAAAILALEPYGEPGLIDVGPLVAAIKTTGRPLVELLPDPSDRRAYYRAARAGVISEPAADRLTIRALGVPLELLYPDLFEVAS
jgi:hypothetical protein